MEQVIILLGKSGSGKGTQAELLREKFGYAHLVCGDLLRARAKDSDFTGKKLAEAITGGALAPTAVIFKLWVDKVEQLQNSKNTKGLIMDGNPRKIKEAYLIDEVFEWYEWHNVKVVLIDITDQEAALRLGKRRICKNKECGKAIPFVGEYKNLEKCPACGGELAFREDDTPESIKKRLLWFQTEVGPVIDYYKETGRLLKVDGSGTIEQVFNNILEVLK